jgi:hypothetical protein
MSLSPATDQDVVTVVVPTHSRADVVGKTIKSIVRQRDVTVGDRSPDGNQALPAKNGDFLASAKLQRQLDAARSRGADRRPFSTTSFERLTPVGGQHLRDSDLDRLHFRLLETTDVESAIEWPNPHDAALSGAAK